MSVPPMQPNNNIHNKIAIIMSEMIIRHNQRWVILFFDIYNLMNGMCFGRPDRPPHCVVATFFQHFWAKCMAAPRMRCPIRTIPWNSLCRLHVGCFQLTQPPWIRRTRTLSVTFCRDWSQHLLFTLWNFGIKIVDYKGFSGSVIS